MPITASDPRPGAFPAGRLLAATLVPGLVIATALFVVFAVRGGQPTAPYVAAETLKAFGLILLPGTLVFVLPIWIWQHRRIGGRLAPWLALGALATLATSPFFWSFVLGCMDFGGDRCRTYQFPYGEFALMIAATALAGALYYGLSWAVWRRFAASAPKT